MANIADLFREGASSAWLFAPTAVALGALHGLEPGHSKTMMAAFIVAVRGTVGQAILLGLSATISHTAIVWIVALAGLYFGAHWNAEANEPYLQIASGALILAVAAWMTWRNWRDHRPRDHRHDHSHDHPHDHDHVHDHAHDHLAAETSSIALDEETMDAHERAHAEDIQRRFASGHVTTGQIILFGLTGGLIPCPASITVLLLCLQLGQLSLGAALVLCFSVGLALTMVAVGVAAALGVRHASNHWSGFEAIAGKAPYLSGALISLVGLYTLYSGFSALA
ncbi:nickel/cobalt efflux transporter RcnA [Methylosinus sp. H3A]|uniref:nickel/cobalt efflux transporter n=1 Tax=Methylosinus sp. H3A TaxID=2785786 RepID=UPI0018C253DC|nr:nickel/cobalt efflux transporter [Methylosinus sp. H3A]MBG0811077.1 nickel/cobalt efflux transporter RcnA [Methylosinus sp. H3A]